MIPIPWWVFSLAANAAIISTEYLNRTAPGGFLTALPRTWWLIVVAQYCLFRSFNAGTGASHWLLAWAVFTIGNSIARVGAVRFFLGGEVTSWTAVLGGVAFMVVGAFVLKGGLR